MVAEWDRAELGRFPTIRRVENPWLRLLSLIYYILEGLRFAGVWLATICRQALLLI